MSEVIPYTSYPVGSPNTGIIPRVARGVPNAMRNVTRAAQPVARLTTTAGATGAAGAGAKKLAGRVLVAKTAYDLARLGLSEDARNEAAAQVENEAENTGAVGRFFSGLLDPVNTAYGITRLTRDAIDSAREADRAAANAPTDEQIAAKRQQTIDVKARKEREKAAAAAAAEAAAADAAAKTTNMSFAEAVEAGLVSPYTPAAEPTAEELAIQALTPEQRAEMEKMSDADYENAPKAKPVYDPDLVNSLFKTAFGTDINPKREKDIKKVEAIEEMLGERGGKLGKATPNQFALEIYRRYGNTIM